MGQFGNWLLSDQWIVLAVLSILQSMHSTQEMEPTSPTTAHLFIALCAIAVASLVVGDSLSYLNLTKNFLHVVSDRREFWACLASLVLGAAYVALQFLATFRRNRLAVIAAVVLLPMLLYVAYPRLDFQLVRRGWYGFNRDHLHATIGVTLGCLGMLSVLYNLRWYDTLRRAKRDNEVASSASWYRFSLFELMVLTGVLGVLIGGTIFFSEANRTFSLVGRAAASRRIDFPMTAHGVSAICYADGTILAEWRDDHLNTEKWIAIRSKRANVRNFQSKAYPEPLVSRERLDGIRTIFGITNGKIATWNEDGCQFEVIWSGRSWEHTVLLKESRED